MFRAMEIVDRFRVATWHIFEPKIPIWVNLGGSCKEGCWSILWPFGPFYGHLVYFKAIWSILRPFGLFCGHLVYFVAIWYILWPFGIFFHVLVCCTKKNLATLDRFPT
jgi:hypothetical protein